MVKTRFRLSEHFIVEEFDCNDGTKVPELYYGQLSKLCEWFLEPLRDKYGACFVHSGFRTPEWNLHVGGASASYHVYTRRRPRQGVAADVEFARGSVRDWHNEATKLRRQNRDGQGGLGYYPQGGFIHIDTRDYPADWDGS